MSALHRFARCLVAALVLALATLTHAFAFPVTWTLSGVTFDDGGTASGYLVYDADSATVTEGAISVAGGNTGVFAPLTYTGSWSALVVNAQAGFYDWAPGFGKYLWISTSGLTDAGGSVPLSTQSYECTNCGNIRYVSAGNVIGTPTPYFTSAAGTTFTVGAAGTFTVTTSAATSVALTGTLPGGVTLTDNGDGTATLAGTPAAGSGGSYALTLTASNGVPPDQTQDFTLTVGEAPTITSAPAATFAVGAAGTFTVTTTGSPVATLGETGALPSGVTFTDNGDGTATLAGTPAAGSGGSYALTLNASNGVATDATQNFTLMVDQAPLITSANAATFTAGASGSFAVTTTGFPAAGLSESGTLPSGVTFTNNGDGTATLAGTPAAGSSGSYPLTLTASNGVSPNAMQNFTLTVNQAPFITSANGAAFTVGAAGTFTVTTAGSPTAALGESGTLPSGVTFVDNGNGTATLAGTPAAGTSGTYVLTLTASNGVLPDATQGFTLTVRAPVNVTPAPTLTWPGATVLLLLLLAAAAHGRRRMPLAR